MIRSIWFGLGLCPVKQQCYLLNVGFTEAEALENRELTDAIYFKAFELSLNLNAELTDWMTSQGLTASEAPHLIDGVVKALVEVLDLKDDDDDEIQGGGSGEVSGEDDVSGCGGVVSGRS